MDGRIGKWIVAMPGVVGFKYYFDLCKKYGFMVFPQFLDNFFHPQKEESNFKRFWRLLNKYKGQVEFAVYPDYRYDLTPILSYETNWIFPLHKQDELDFVLSNDFEWVGTPYRASRRDYTIGWFVDSCKDHALKSWYLGWFYRKLEKENILFHFEGMDTTILTSYCVKRGKVWIGWGKHIATPKLHRTVIFELSLRNFRDDLEKLAQRDCQTLVSYVQGDKEKCD